MNLSLSVPDLALALRRQSSAGRIHVDSVNGSDLFTGASPQSALASLSAAAAAASDGARIALAAGSVWRDSLDLSSVSDVTVEPYGDIATDGLPVIRGDDELDGVWETSADRGDAHTNVYSQEFTWSGEATDTDMWMVFWEHPEGTDDVLGTGVTNLAYASSLSACQSTPGSFFVDSAELGANPAVEFNVSGASRTVTVYIHPTGSTDPRSDGKSYHGAARLVCVYVGDNSTVRQIHAYRAGNHAGSFHGKANCLFDRCLAYDSVSHQMLMGYGEFRDCIAFHRFLDARRGAILIEHYGGAEAQDTTAIFRRCIAVSTPQVRDAQTPVGLGGHTSGGHRYERWIAEDCVALECTIQGNSMRFYDVVRSSVINGYIAADADEHVTITDCPPRHGPRTMVPAQNPYLFRQGSVYGTSDPVPHTVTGLRAYTREMDDIPPMLDVANMTLERSLIVIEGTGTIGGNTFCLSTRVTGVDLTMNRNVFMSREGFIRVRRRGGGAVGRRQRLRRQRALDHGFQQPLHAGGLAVGVGHRRDRRGERSRRPRGRGPLQRRTGR